MEAEPAKRADNKVDNRANSPLLRLASEESITLRGIISPDSPTVDRQMLDRLIGASQAALSRQLELLRLTLDDHARSEEAPTLEAVLAQAKALRRLEPMLEHTARLVHESLVLQRLRTLLHDA